MIFNRKGSQRGDGFGASFAGRLYNASVGRGVESIVHAAKVAKTILHGSASGILADGEQAGKGAVGQRVISPGARDRVQLWRGKLSPQRVESILVESLQGDLVSLQGLWELMERTWPRLATNSHKMRKRVARVHFRVVPFAEDDEEATESAKAKAQFVESVWRQWSPDAVRQEAGAEGCIYHMCGAMNTGLCLQEVLWIMRPDGAIVPKGSVWVHPRYYGMAATGADLQIRPGGPGTPWVDIPRDQFLVSVYQTQSGTMLANGLFRVLAWWWCAAMFGRDWLLSFCERYGLPTVWATFGEGASDGLQADIAEMLSNVGSAGWGLFPAGTDIKLIESRQGVTGLPPQAGLMDLADKVCDICYFGGTLTTDIGDVGSKAAATVHAGGESENVQELARWAADEISYQLIPTLIRLNFGDDSECPYLEPDLGVKEDAVQSFRRDVWKGFLADGTVNDVLANLTDLKELTRAVGLPVNEDYVDPYLPVKDQAGNPVTGEVTKDSEGDIVGGVSEGGARLGPGLSGGRDAGADAQPMDGVPADPKESKDDAEDAAVVEARAADAVAADALYDLTGVKAKWLAGVKPAFHRMAVLAQSSRVSDADFVSALETARKQMPEMFGRLNSQALQDALEKAMSTAVVQGAVDGARKRPMPGQHAQAGGTR